MKQEQLYAALVLLIISPYQFFCYEYLQSDKAEFGEVILIDYEYNPMEEIGYQSEETTIVFQNKYIIVPQIIIGLTLLDIGATKDLSFDYSIKSIDQEKVIVKLEKHGDTQIQVLQDTNVFCRSIKFTNYVSGQNQNVEFSLPYLLGKERQVQCFLIGIKTQKADMEININISNINSIQYTITINSYNISTFEYVNINCIESFKDTSGANPYSMISNIQQLKSSIKLDVDNNQTLIAVIDKDIAENSPIGIVGLISTSNTISSSLRVTISLKLYSNYQQQIALGTWNENLLDMLSVGYFHYKMYNCQVNESINKINFSDQNKCVVECPEKYYQTSFYSTNICKSCEKSCQTCNNDLTCLTCPPKYKQNEQQLCSSICDSPIKFVYNNQCYENKPINTYCDNLNMCHRCEIDCKECDSSLKKCISCNYFQYLYNGICSIKQPVMTFCKIRF